MLSNFKTRYLWIILLGSFIFAYFSRSDIRDVNEFNPLTLKDPIQTSASSKEVIKFVRDNYQFQLTPLFNYKISGLIVHKLNYWFDIGASRAAPVDACIMWGENLRNKIHQKRVEFSQDGRWCYWKGSDFNLVNVNQIANNHLLVSDKKLEKKLKQLTAGDQVTLQGKLVNVKAFLIGKGSVYEPESFAWNSSATRADSGNGSCEVIYVEDLQVLQHAQPLYHYLFQISGYGLILLFCLELIIFFFNVLMCKNP